MAFINWKLGRWICLAVSVITLLFLFGITDSVLGMTLQSDLVGFKISTILGVANSLSAYILYKVL